MPGNICYPVLVLFLLSPFLTKAQTSNPCGVKAVMNPSGDSVITSPTGVYFQSASTNATDYKFMFDDWQYPMNTPVNWGIGTGLTKVSLIAYNGSCTDTAVAYYFYAGNFPSATDNPQRLYGYSNRFHEVTNLIGVQSGGYMLAGRRTSSSYPTYAPEQGLLIRTKDAGCVEWARKLEGSYHSNIQMVKESPAGGFFMLADVDFKQFIVKLDASGNALWSKRLELLGGNNVINNGMDALPDGGVVVVGVYAPSRKPVVVRLDNNGNIIWQREYDYNFTQYGGFSNIVLKDNFLYLGGNAGYNISTYFDAFLIKINYATGQAIWTKKYANGAVPLHMQEILNIDSTLLVNIITSSGVPNTPYIGGFMRLDTSGQVLAASVIGENYSPNWLMGPYSLAGSHLIRSGKTFYIISHGSHTLALQPGISYYTKLIKLDSTYQVSWVQSYGGAGASRYYYNASAPQDGVAIAGNEIGAAMSPQSISWYLSVKPIDSSGGNPASSCNFYNQPWVTTPVTILPQPVQLTSDLPSGYVSVTRDIPLFPFYPEMRFECPDYVDSCSYLKLSGPRSICNLSQPYVYTTHKNTGCGQPTIWEVPSNVQTIVQTGSTVTVRFPGFGRYVIYGRNPLSCTPVEDSIVIMAESKSPPLNLGPDRQICPQNSITLRAGPKFFSYAWNDGSTDSLLTVNLPGQYWVKAIDSCNNEFNDTINISLAPPIPFSAGPDRIKCNHDTLHLNADPGFIKYSWSPAYQISNTNAQKVIIDPLIDTAYTVIAEKTPGCFAYDTVNITVHRSPAIHVGNDTSFCAGDSLVLDAGPGFAQYKWRHGSTAQQVTLFDAGKYSVMATTTDGCTSYDTMAIVAVFTNPVVDLGNDPTLCLESTRVLQAGNFASYLWQNGDTYPSITVTELGRYYVTVTDNHHCEGSDTLDITRWMPLPAGFLLPDTALCSYGSLELKSIHPYSQYVWSNGSSLPSITIKQAGTYWLQVTDEHNCTGKDTIVVKAKDCLYGLYAPSAFTPNQDGKNDVFKPLLFGNVIQYRLSIYNRWGQLVFSTTDRTKGWDGNNGGHVQNSNAFIWVCTYQFEGEKIKTERGIVTLIK